MTLGDFIKQAPRAFLLRIEMRLRHTLDNWEPLLRLFKQANILERRTALIEERMTAVSDQLNAQVERLERVAQTLAASRGVNREELEIQLAPLQARLAQLDRALSERHAEPFGREGLDAVERLQERVTRETPTSGDLL